MNSEPSFSLADAGFWGFVVTLAGFVITYSDNFNRLPYPYPLLGIVSPFLILGMMAVWIFHRTKVKMMDEAERRRTPRYVG